MGYRDPGQTGDPLFQRSPAGRQSQPAQPGRSASGQPVSLPHALVSALASNAGIIVRSYEDDPVAVGETAPSGAGRFLRATLRPHILVEAGADLDRADAIHHEIHKVCFIARSVIFPVDYAATYGLQ